MIRHSGLAARTSPHQTAFAGVNEGLGKTLGLGTFWGFQCSGASPLAAATRSGAQPGLRLLTCNSSLLRCCLICWRVAAIDDMQRGFVNLQNDVLSLTVKEHEAAEK